MREIEIQIFNKHAYLFDKQLMFQVGLKPTDLPWNYGFKSSKLKTLRCDLISEDKQNFIIVDNDIL